MNLIELLPEPYKYIFKNSCKVYTNLDGTIQTTFKQNIENLIQALPISELASVATNGNPMVSMATKAVSSIAKASTAFSANLLFSACGKSDTQTQFSNETKAMLNSIATEVNVLLETVIGVAKSEEFKNNLKQFADYIRNGNKSDGASAIFTTFSKTMDEVKTKIKSIVGIIEKRVTNPSALAHGNDVSDVVTGAVSNVVTVSEVGASSKQHIINKVKELIQENATLTQERNQVKEENATLIQERNQEKEENATLIQERNQAKELIQEKDTLTKECKKVKEENATLTKKYTQVKERNEMLTKEYYKIKEENATLTQKCDKQPNPSATQTDTYKIYLYQPYPGDENKGVSDAIFKSIEKNDVTGLSNIISFQYINKILSSNVYTVLINNSVNFLNISKSFKIGDDTIRSTFFTPFQYACYCNSYNCVAFLLSCIMMGGKDLFIKHTMLKIGGNGELAELNAFKLIAAPYKVKQTGLIANTMQTMRAVKKKFMPSKSKRNELEKILTDIAQTYDFNITSDEFNVELLLRHPVLFNIPTPPPQTQTGGRHTTRKLYTTK